MFGSFLNAYILLESVKHDVMRIVDLCILEIIVSLISLFSSVIARFGLSILRDIYIFRCGSICINGYVAHSVRIFQIVNCYIRSWNLGILSYLGTLSNLRILSNFGIVSDIWILLLLWIMLDLWILSNLGILSCTCHCIYWSIWSCLWINTMKLASEEFSKVSSSESTASSGIQSSCYVAWSHVKLNFNWGHLCISKYIIC